MIHWELGDCRIEDADIPFAICATDIETGEQLKEANIAVPLDLSHYSLTNIVYARKMISASPGYPFQAKN